MNEWNLSYALIEHRSFYGRVKIFIMARNTICVDS